MEITNRIKNAVAAFRKTENSSSDPSAFLKYGNQKIMPQTWSTPQINDQDFYTGYGFAVINKRANRSVVLGKKFLYTDASEAIIKKSNETNVTVTHPYLSLIRSSVDFSERDFWYNVSTYLDLEGVYYLMAVRTVTNNGTVGNIQKFSLLNPYHVRQVINSKGELGGYVENSGEMQRDIPKEMIIPITLLNPFDDRKAYSLADAARDSQFTLKQANDFAREAIDGNLNSPGILSSAIELPDDQFDNFVSRVKNHGRGEPLFGNGAGTVSWVNMQTDLDKAALDKINSINRDVLLAISGLSKTGVGVEESGTGREVSRTQKDDFTENAIMPQIENIIDSLNLDYRKYYATEYKNNKYTILLDNPLETNRDAEQADIDIRDSQFTLMQSLVADGYSNEIASKYAKGEIDITALGEPTPVVPVTPPVVPPTTPAVDTPATPPVTPANSGKDKQVNVYEGYAVPVIQYLEDIANQVDPLSEKSSVIYSIEEPADQSSSSSKTFKIDHISEMNNLLVAIIDENSFIKLAEFNENADRVAIISKLNKRYKNQPVAVKKKIDLEHKCSSHTIELVKNAAFDKQDQIDSSTYQLMTSAKAAEQNLFDWYNGELLNGVTNPHPTDMTQFENFMEMPFAVWFTVMFPIFASYRLAKTSADLGINDPLPVVAMTEDVKNMISDFAKRESVSHMGTIRNDIENALAIIRAQTSDPQEARQMFQLAFEAIQSRRAIAIASNAADRIFNFSQYEADLQFLTRANLVNQAYKVLFSLTGAPCSICASIIAATNAAPIPFTSAFANMGQTIEGEDGLKMTFNYEQIEAGNVHPNCHCAYMLIIKPAEE